MPKFRYRALTGRKEKVEGVYNAKSKDEVLAILATNGYYPLLVEEVKYNLNVDLEFKKGVKLKDIAIFCRQFYTMIDAGVPMDACLDTLSTQSTHPILKKALREIYDDVKRGDTLSNAMSHHPKVFPSLFIKMIQSGEVSGNLDTILLRMAIYYEKENKVNSKIKNAMIYPAVLASVSIIVVTIIMIFVMPTFIDMFDQNGIELPLLTKALLWTSDFMSLYFIFVLIVIFIIRYLFKIYLKTEHGYYYLSKFKLWVPILKPLNQKIIISRFTRTIAILLASGISIAQSIQIVSEVVQNKLAEEALLGVREKLIKGEGLSGPMQESGIFPPMLSSMIHIGEETGALGDILYKTADFYDDELEAQIQATIALIEPLMIVIMGIIIGAIVMAIMIPMFEMYTQT